MTDLADAKSSLAPADSPEVIHLSPRKFLLGCVVAAVAILAAAPWIAMPTWLLATEVFATILGLFLLGSMRYQLNKNALTYGMGLVIVATFLAIWWPTAALRQRVLEHGPWAAWPTVRHYLFTFHGLDDLVHLDTMLFILGLTLFVSVVAQTRVLEELTLWLLRRFDGGILATVLAVTAAVAVASGILDGVSMIGLTIRTLVIILLMASAPLAAIRYAVMICTVVTTVCGMWLAYGEPPNLIMKANLVAPNGSAYLSDGFFLNYCLPAAAISYLVVAWNLRRRLRGTRIHLEGLDLLDANVASVRFLQASRHGEVLTPIEFVEDHAGEFDSRAQPVLARLHHGEPIGHAMVQEGVPAATRQRILGEFIHEELAQDIDSHYALAARGDKAQAASIAGAIAGKFTRMQSGRRPAQLLAGLALLPFVCLLVTHAVFHLPLFLASFAGFAVAILGIAKIAPMRRLALHEAWHEYAEYYFLFPLFLSITLLAKIGFFDHLQVLLRQGIEHSGPSHIAFAQFAGATVLSALLDNNVVADFASHALHGLSVGLIHLFAMAQIAGYAVGGCWTHIGCAQSVVAFAFIRRDIDERYTPLQWIREMTPALLTLIAALTAYIYLRGLFVHAG